VKQHLHNYSGFSIGIQYPVPQSIVEEANQWMENNPFLADLQFSYCVVARTNDKVVGAIIFAKEESTIIGGTMQTHMRIQTGYVVPSARKQGLYKHLHKIVEIIAKGSGCISIISRVNAKNTEMLSILDSLGKTIDHHIVVKKLS
jgi:GNAT superfamily N-acetyltransferase